MPSVGSAECALLDGNVVDDVQAMDLDVRVGEGAEPATEELDAGCFSLAAHPTRRLEDDVVCEHLREPIQVMGIERVRPLSNASRAVIVIKSLLWSWMQPRVARLRVVR